MKSKVFNAIRFYLGGSFILFSLFPWVSFRTNTLDTQPWFAIIGLLFILLCYDVKLKKGVYFIVMLPFLGVLLSVNSIDSYGFTEVRGLLSYVFLSISILAFSFYVRLYSFPLKIIVSANLIYLLFGIAQILFGEGAVSSLAPVRTTLERGVTSLAVEPTYFGVVLFFFSWIYLIIGRYRVAPRIKFLIAINIGFMVFIAQSSMAVLFLIVGLFFLLLYRIKLSHVSAIVVFLYSGYFAVHYFLEGTRLFNLLKMAWEVGVYGIVHADASINYRVSAVVFPYLGMINSYLMPNGLSAYQDFAVYAVNFFNGYFWYGEHGRIMSYVGTILFELGFIGILVIILTFFLLQNGRFSRLLEVSFLLVILHTAIPLASPLVSIIFVALIITKKRLTIS